MGISVDILKRNDVWNSYTKEIEETVLFSLNEEGVQDAEVSILLTDDLEIQKLNSQFRNKDTPTNVLAFPAYEGNFLGDIAVSIDTIRKEASDHGKTTTDHIKHIILHAILHLLGYNHIEEKERKIMEEREISILKKLNIKNPYVI